MGSSVVSVHFRPLSKKLRKGLSMYLRNRTRLLMGDMATPTWTYRPFGIGHQRKDS